MSLAIPYMIYFFVSVISYRLTIYVPWYIRSRQYTLSRRHIYYVDVFEISHCASSFAITLKYTA